MLFGSDVDPLLGLKDDLNLVGGVRDNLPVADEGEDILLLLVCGVLRGLTEELTNNLATLVVVPEVVLVVDIVPALPLLIKASVLEVNI